MILSGTAKQAKTQEIMAELNIVEKQFKQMKAQANLLCQQGNFCMAKNIIDKLKSITK